MEKLLRTLTMCVFLLLLNIYGVYAQQRVVKGTVKDNKGQPLSGVSVKIKNTTAGTLTTADGSFTITVPSPSSVLVFSTIGYASQETAVKGSTISIALQEQIGSLDQVVVQAFTVQKKATQTGSTSTVSPKELTATSVANVSNMLVGNVPGLSGVQSSGEPGRNGSRLLIRGIGTTSGSTDPLVVIDGIQQAAERPYDQLNSMDANEIESVTVLKDASTTAVYGIRGANGVIIVTTKRGKAGKPVFSVSSTFGSTSATNLLHGANSYQWASMRNEAIAVEKSSFGNSTFDAYLFSNDDLWKMQNNRDYLPAEVDAMTQLTAEQKAQLKNAPALYYGSRDLFADQFGGKGPQSQLNMQVSGGSQKVKYYTSLGYFTQGSILNNTSYYGANTASNFSRINFRSNFDITAVKNLTIRINLAGQFGNTSGPGYNNGSAGTTNPYDFNARYGAIMQYIFDSGPLTAPGLVDGRLVNSYAGIGGSPDNPLGVKLGSSKGAQNPVRNLLASGRESLFNTLLSNSVVVRYDMPFITPGLAFQGTANYDNNYVKAVAYLPSLPEYSVRRSSANPNILQFYGGATGANVFNADPGHNSVWRKTYFDAGFDYNRTFGAHTVTGVIRGTAQRYSIPNDAFNTPSGIIGFLGQGRYNFKERYLADVTLGYNGTEQFQEGKRFGFFPAYGAGWIISREPFFPENKWLTYFKVRASYGEVGNDGTGLGRYLYLPNTFNLNASGYNYYWGASDGSVANPNYPGAIEGNIGNPNVTWERAVKKNLGIEAHFFKEKLSVTADLFQESRDNILTRSQIIPGSIGIPANSQPPVNVGIVKNRGYELVMGWTDNIGRVGYYLTGNVNYARNNIVYQAEVLQKYPWLNATGFAVSQYKGFVTDGFFNNQSELNNRPVYAAPLNNNVALGDVRYKDIDGDGKVDINDRVPVGYSFYPRYTYSLKAGFNFKGFDVSSLFTGTAQASFNMANYDFTNTFFQNAGFVSQWMYDGHWTADKVARGEEIKYPRAQINGVRNTSNNYLASDLWIVSSSYLRLKNIEVGYTFPQLSFLKRSHISSLRIFGNGNNIATWNSELYKRGIDPEAQDIGGRAIYPITRVIVFGAQLRF